MPPKASQPAAAGQKSLMSWFGKKDGASQAANGVTATPPPKPASTSIGKAAAPSSGSSKSLASSSASKNVRPSVASDQKSRASSSSSTATSPATLNIADDDDDDEDDEKATSSGKAQQQQRSSSQSVPAKRPIVHAGSEDEDDDEAAVRQPVKRRAASNKSIVESSDEDIDKVITTRTSPRKKPAAAKQNGQKKQKKGSDDDDFDGSAAASDSDDLWEATGGAIDLTGDLTGDSDSEAESAISELSEPKPKKKKTATTQTAKSKSAAASSPKGSRPPLKSGGSGSGGLSAIRTQAEQKKAAAKEKKQAAEQAFSFLANPKDADGLSPGDEGYDPRTLYIPQSAWKKFSPFENQFWSIKQYHFDTVLFFQKGKFFELYEGDAEIGHREFDLKLTDRVTMKMVGVPETSFDYWAAKFLAQGYKVGRVDQCETALGAEMRQKDEKKDKGKPAAKDKIVRRELRSVLTSGTLVDGSLLEDDLASHCVAVKEYTPSSSALPEFGVCVLDAATAEFSLSAFSDDIGRTQLETLIRQLKPKELIHEKGNLSVSTLRVLRNTLSIDCQWTALKAETEFLPPDETKVELRKLFKAQLEAQTEGEDAGMPSDEDVEAAIPDKIKEMYGQETAMSALGGMIWYLKQLNLDSDLVTAKNFNIYDPLSQGKALILDGQTLAHIEVLQNSLGGTEGTLIQLLGRCITPFGKRLFKIWLCAPLREVDAINDRLDAVDDLLANAGFVDAFDKICKKLPDLERMLSRVHAKTIKKKDFVKVVDGFVRIANGIEKLLVLAGEFKSVGIPGLLRSVPDLSQLIDRVKSLYKEEGDDISPVPGKHAPYEKARDAVAAVEANLKEELASYQDLLKTSKISFKDVGTKDIYQVQVPASTKVPSNWTQMSATKEVKRYYSPQVAKLVQQLKEARERQTTAIQEFQYELYGEWDKDYTSWMEAIKLVAELDCLVSLAKSSRALGEPCVRPELVESDQAFVDFEDLRHPCVLSSSGDFIPNNVQLGDDHERSILLTGPNMAGKSTLLRMTCTAVIMAQLGCYVPAAKARLSPVDAIYSRMGANDFIFANASTFKVEMDDCTKILTKSTPKTLYILDELGRGTSTFDGMAIAFSVLHRLATHVGSIGFFATHFTSLTDDFAKHPQIRLCNMQTHVDDETRAVVFLYKLVEGVAAKSYGPHVAAMAGLPEQVVKKAIAVSAEFEAKAKQREQKMRANETLPLTLQADAAFLVHLAHKLSLDSSVDGKAQLGRTIDCIRQAVLKAHAAT